MAKQIMVSDAVYKLLEYLKEELHARSFSDVILKLYGLVPIPEEQVINQAFEDLRGKIAKYFDDFEILELTRLFYLNALGTSNNKLQKAKEVLIPAFQKALGLLRKREKM